MKNIIVFIALLITGLPVYAQTYFSISGKIIDADTKLPMQGASVFAQNTTMGTATHADGSFTLQLPAGGYDIVVTFTGYQTETKRVSGADAGNNNWEIALHQKQNEMQDVVVKATYEVADGWEKYGDFFLENFIGKTDNSKQTTITNKEVLKFYYYKRKNKLKVLASAPLVIENKALGYSISYTLDSFIHEYNTQVSQYTGYPLFSEMVPANPEQQTNWNNARLVAYHGSILHFMRSLYHRQLKESGFEIQFLVNDGDKQNAIPVKDFYGALNYAKDDSTTLVSILPNQREVAVIYKAEMPAPLYLETNPDSNPKFELSVLLFAPMQTINIEQNGFYFNQDDFTISSYWGWEKMADMLPYDYQLPSEK